MEVPQLQYSDKMVDVPGYAVLDGYGRRCDHAVTMGLVLEVPQTQFIARVCGPSSFQ